MESIAKQPEISLYRSPTGQYIGLTQKDRNKLINMIDVPSFPEEKYDAAVDAMKLYGVKDVRVIHRIDLYA